MKVLIKCPHCGEHVALVDATIDVEMLNKTPISLAERLQACGVSPQWSERNLGQRSGVSGYSTEGDGDE